MKFKFRLDPVLKIRENDRAQKQAELGRAYEAVRIVENKLKEVQTEIVSNSELGRQAIQQGRISVDYLLAVRRHEAFLLAQQSDVQTSLQQIRLVIEERRLALIEADKKVKVLEKLREKQKSKHLQEEALAEMKQMDEIAQSARHRNR